jgi:hypothetical protein
MPGIVPGAVLSAARRAAAAHRAGCRLDWCDLRVATNEAKIRGVFERSANDG